MDVLLRWASPLPTLITSPDDDGRLAQLLGPLGGVGLYSNEWATDYDNPAHTFDARGEWPPLTEWPPVSDGSSEWHRAPGGGYIARYRPQSIGTISRYAVRLVGVRGSISDLVSRPGLERLIVSGDLTIHTLRTEARGAYVWEDASGATFRLAAPLLAERGLAVPEWVSSHAPCDAALLPTLTACWHAVHAAASPTHAETLARAACPSHPSTRAQVVVSKWPAPLWAGGAA